MPDVTRESRTSAANLFHTGRDLAAGGPMTIGSIGKGPDRISGHAPWCAENAALNDVAFAGV
ncbi:hypothetical protein RGR602_PC00096 (plasmid) [Rhizobium gallicum bv. gallicum R602sp]|uniref:Uncharacterized protein n=1 Tax=Rhizobium gallicum bv. gallicum R602sp TaxID=1041138 RepID=A0A0B4XC29_9HYPH|nr:hypothetical protein RGR602_PC00096 [Rhizobium gallicum bv. gallicum R602sp]